MSEHRTTKHRTTKHRTSHVLPAAAVAAAALLAGPAPASATNPDVSNLSVRASCVDGLPGYLVSFSSPGTAARVRAPGGEEAQVPSGAGFREVNLHVHADDGSFTVLGGSGSVLGTAPAPRGHSCDGWPSRERYLLEGDDQPGSPQALTGLAATPAATTGAGVQVFRAVGGAFYFDQRAEAGHVVRGALYDYYRSRGEYGGPLGAPLSSEVQMPTFEGFSTRFQGGTAYWSADGGGRTVKGAIAAGYAANGGERLVGPPATEEFGRLVRGGYGQHFLRGSMYWSPASGSWPVEAGPIRDRWAQLGWERSFAGYPVEAHESFSRGGLARLQRFEGATFVWYPGRPVSTVRGAIRDTWDRTGGMSGALSSPTTDEFGPLVGGGSGQHFASGSAYWSPATGGHTVLSTGNCDVRGRWGELGWETGAGLGYPLEDTPFGVRPGWLRQHFQRGTLYCDSDVFGRGPVLLVKGAIRDAYAAAGWEGGRFGHPLTEEQPVPGGVRQDFEGGSLTYTWATGRVS